MIKKHFISVFENMSNPRYQTARKTWELNNIDKIEIHDKELQRKIDDGFKKMPYVIDIINKGIEIVNSESNFIILFTNADSCLLPTVEEELNTVNDEVSLLFSRRDISYDFSQPLSSEEILKTETFAGIDGFAFTKNFWLNNREVFLDTIFGAEFWDYLFYLQLSSYSHVVKNNTTLYHRTHTPVWSLASLRNAIPSQKFNIRVAREYLSYNSDKVEGVYKEYIEDWQHLFKAV